MNLLITSAARKVLLVEAFQDACAKTVGGEVWAGDLDWCAASLHAADRGVILPRADAADFAPRLKAFCTQNDIKLIVPTRDGELPVLAALRDEFKEAGIVIAVGSSETIEAVQDKRIFVKRCEESDLGVPKTYTDLSEFPDGPVFVKPRWGSAGEGARLVSDPEQAKRLFEEEGGKMVFQELVEAPEFTIDVFCDWDHKPISIVPRERIRVVSGESVVGRTIDHPGLVEEAAKLAQVFSLVGHNTLQAFVRGADEILFIEVNPRYGGGANLGFRAGAPTPLFLMQLLNGEAVLPRIGGYEKGLVMLRHSTDCFISAEDLEGEMDEI
ncbi:ATP-grasp domain-containing protein [Akkermansiaceae bacterium]|nr:ATP-grasp domain-containing protein [bacterium]MDA7655069.1 ATP-grasp domain-containing protein [Akkermansiaceae bacterium]MDB4801556.1 ATP-grasp domain-containing protein [Akkermansiaceae bacterium]